MYINVTENEFVNTFRAIRPDNFSLSGLRALFDFYETLEEETGKPMEFDPIAICCEWSELSADEVRSQYSIDEDVEVKDYLEENTMFISLGDNKYLVMDF